MHFNSFRSRAKWKKKSRFLTDWSKTKSWNRVTEVSITFFIKRGEKRRKLSFSHQAKITTDQREETEKENKLPAFFAKENCYNHQNGFRVCSSSSVSSLPLNFKKYREIAERKLSLGEVGRQNRKWSTPLNSDSCEQFSHLIHSLIHHQSPIPQLRASKPQKNMDGTFQFSTANWTVEKIHLQERFCPVSLHFSPIWNFKVLIPRLNLCLVGQTENSPRFDSPQNASL